MDTLAYIYSPINSPVLFHSSSAIRSKTGLYQDYIAYSRISPLLFYGSCTIISVKGLFREYVQVSGCLLRILTHCEFSKMGMRVFYGMS